MQAYNDLFYQILANTQQIVEYDYFQVIQSILSNINSKEEKEE